jgi:hypothetical protein
MKKLILLGLLIPFISFSQKTYVPDNNFEQKLINLGIDSALDDSVTTANINTVSTLDVNSQGISDLTGIEDFTALTSLIAYSNNLSSLDLSQNISLTTLFTNWNASLFCVQVNQNQLNNLPSGWNVDPTTSFFFNHWPALSANSCDSYSWNGTTYTLSGVYTYTTTNSEACDSTATLNLTITNSTASTDNVGTHCDSYTWVDGVTYTASNNSATWTTTNAAGCDNVATLNLTITNSTTSTDNVGTHCDSYTWVDGVTYTTSNSSATWITTNAAGCDNVATLNLTITNSTASTDNVGTHCDSYTWVDGITYTTSNSSATWTTTNATGCDNVATLNLTITNSTASTDNVGTHCDSYTWVDGVTYTTSNSSATWITTNAAGCDNVATLNLSITNSTTSTDNVGTHCDSYTWVDGVTYTTSNNSATWTTTNIAGCDNVATLDLTITNSTASTDIQVHCDSYTWIDGNTYTTSGIYTDVSTNASGCNHTETLELTINSVIASINQLGDTLSAVTTPIGLNANWYNIQTEDNTTRIWLMEENTSSFSPTFECSYFIVVSDENGCIDTSETYYYGANASRIGSFITSPNPTSGLINVKFDNSKNQFVMLELISSNGSKLDEFITVDNNLNIDLSKYPSGTYYLYFNSEDATQGCALEKRQKISTKIILNK